MLTPEQLAMRQTGIGASEIGVIAGLSRWSSPHEVWGRKCGLLPPVEETVAMRVGNALEEAIATLYSQDTGAVLLPADTVRHPEHAFVLATPDRWVQGERKIVEIKTVGWRMAYDWGDDADAIPDYYRAQIEWQMLACGVDSCDVAALIGGTDFRIYQFTRDPELAALLLTIGREFWGHVERQEPPPVDGSTGASKVLAARFKANNGAMIQSTARAEELAHELAKARAESIKASAQEEALSNAIAEIIGYNDGIIGDGWKITWKAPKPSSKTDWKAVATELGAPAGVIAKHTVTKPGSRRFLPSGSLFTKEASK